jgi:hypothetical protein
MAQEANAQGNSLGRTESQMLSDACIAGIYFAKGALTKRTRMSNHRQ